MAASKITVNIDYASDDSCQIQLWAKGTHAPDVFIPACEDALMKWDERQVSLTGTPVSHKHWRTVRADAETKSRGVCDSVHVASQPGRGAYAVTILDTWLPLHSFQPAKTDTQVNLQKVTDMSRDEWNKVFAAQIHERSGMEPALAMETAIAADDAFEFGDDPKDAAEEEMSCWDAD
jgi:hypothetical protein